MDDEDNETGIPHPLTLLYCAVLALIFGRAAAIVLDFVFELAFDLFRKGLLREPLYTWTLGGVHLALYVCDGILLAFFIRLLTGRSWRASAAWGFLCSVATSVVSAALSMSFSRVIWDLRHAPLEIASLALGCVVGARLCVEYEYHEPVRAFRELLMRFVVWR